MQTISNLIGTGLGTAGFLQETACIELTQTPQETPLFHWCRVPMCAKALPQSTSFATVEDGQQHVTELLQAQHARKTQTTAFASFNFCHGNVFLFARFVN